MSCAAILCGLYLEASVQVIQPRALPPVPEAWWYYDRTRVDNPFGVIALGYEWQPNPATRWFIELRHESSVRTPIDRGEDSVRAGFRWYPARKGR